MKWRAIRSRSPSSPSIQAVGDWGTGASPAGTPPPAASGVSDAGATASVVSGPPGADSASSGFSGRSSSSSAMMRKAGPVLASWDSRDRHHCRRTGPGTGAYYSVYGPGKPVTILQRGNSHHSTCPPGFVCSAGPAWRRAFFVSPPRAARSGTRRKVTSRPSAGGGWGSSSLRRS